MSAVAAPPSLDTEDPHRLRLAFRAGLDVATTARLAPGHVQGNLVILPADEAREFLRYCALNPKPCPVLGVGAPGDPSLAALGRDLDIRTDLPRYRVWRDGVLADEPQSVVDVWRADLVAIVLGCSYSFDQLLLEAGVRLRHWERGQNPPYWRTAIDTVPAGPFGGKLMVSMRPLRPADAIRAIEVTSRYPAVHGAPIHLGFPEAIGIADLDHPDGGEALALDAGELPVFWACGVTPQSAIEQAKPKLCITHMPGAMLVTDLTLRSLVPA
jgi:uncharacterized protein YcsI (UPF0317 family)